MMVRAEAANAWLDVEDNVLEDAVQEPSFRANANRIAFAKCFASYHRCSSKAVDYRVNESIRGAGAGVLGDVGPDRLRATAGLSSL